MKKKNIYRVTGVEYNKRTEHLTWEYGGREYWAQGDFFIDGDGVLHHTFITPRGKEKEVKIKLD